MSQEYRKEYYEKNKDKIKEHMRTKILCLACNTWVTRNTLPKHKLSKKHTQSKEIEKAKCDAELNKHNAANFEYVDSQINHMREQLIYSIHNILDKKLDQDKDYLENQLLGLREDILHKCDYKLNVLATDLIVGQHIEKLKNKKLNNLPIEKEYTHPNIEYSDNLDSESEDNKSVV